jgi:hypothetical protein
MSTKTHLPAVPQKFNPFNTFNTVATFNSALNTRRCHTVRRRVPDPCETEPLTPDHELEVEESALPDPAKVQTL